MKNQRTYSQRKEDVERKWHLIDVEGKVLGRMATDIALKLMGKHKPTYSPHIDGGDYVVVTNAAKVALTRNKENTKIYYSHSGFPGGLKQRTFAEMIEKTPEKVIEKAVFNMLPKNKLRSERMARLKVYAGADHKHTSQLGEQ